MTALKSTVVLGFFQLSMFSSLLGESLKSNESSFVGNLKSLISDYHNKYTKPPTSWNEMMEGGFLDEVLLSRGRLYLDFENRYRFPDTKQPIVISNRNETVVVMAIESGLEGDNPDEPRVENRAGRWLIIRMPTGGFETRKYSEIFLRNSFKKAGFDLADYTGADGKWLPAKKISNSKQDIGRPNGGAQQQSSHEGGQGVSKVPDLKVKHSNSEKLRWTPWIFWLIGGLGAAAMTRIIVSLVRKRQRSIRDLMNRDAK